MTSVWEQRKLGDEATEMFAGGDIDKEKVVDNGKYPIYANALTNDGIVGYYDDYYRVKAPAVTVTGRGDVGHAQARTTDFTPVVRLLAIRSKHDIYFLENAINNHGVIVESTGVPQLTVPQLGNYTISFPKTIDEETKIGEYFYAIDHLITLHQRKNDTICLNYTFVWEQRKLNELNTFFTDGNYGEKYPKESDLTDSSSGVPFLTGGNLKNGKLIVDGANYITKEKHAELTSGHLVLDDIVIAVRGSLGALGYVNTENIDWNINSQLAILRTDKEQLLGSYLVQFLLSGIAQSNLQKRITGSALKQLPLGQLKDFEVPVTNIEEQQKIGDYFKSLDHLITLHQCKPFKMQKSKEIVWEQRKLSELATMHARIGWQNLRTSEFLDSGDYMLITGTDFEDGSINYNTCHYVEKERYDQDPHIQIRNGSILITKDGTLGKVAYVQGLSMPATLNAGVFNVEIRDENITDEKYLFQFLKAPFLMDYVSKHATGGTIKHLNQNILVDFPVSMPSVEEQQKIGEYFSNLDNLITLHHHKQKTLKISIKYIKIIIIIKKETKIMPELETLIEKKLIDQLVYGDSQWTYREDLKTEADLWKNFRYILEQNNKDRLNGEALSDSEFEQVKNQLQFSSFYKAGEWLVGENGKVMVHVQRGTERLHLVVMNHEHIAGGTSVYEVINQYQALDTDYNSSMPARDRRFDVTLMINGIPMIHIELKNKQHSYMDGFWQIKKYIGEGKFTGIFSAVQMFVISNGVDTKYFAAASDTELNAKFVSGWLDKENTPVSDYLDFAKSVLRIPEAHEMVARYTVLDEDAKRLIILRPYQIHAIESIREASKRGQSGFVWHTTGSGKTLTSYKATRNLLMDIPSLDKTIFLIDRKDLDAQTTQAFQAYANNDLIDVNETDNVFDLKKKLKSDDRQVIVTTIQKMQRLITKNLQEDTPEYQKIKGLKIAFVVDECHRAVTPGTKRELERFFGNSMWYGFTGTPRFAENPYAQLGDLPRTTEELYGEILHKYTIQNAIKDNAVLGFQVEHNGPKNVSDETDPSVYDNEAHMLGVLDIILNKSYQKLGFQNGKGQTYEGLLTTSSIQIAQRYYELLTRVKNGETSLVIDERIKQVLPDFPKFAITYSVSENEEGSQVNQQKMQSSLDDYNEMFGTKYEVSQIQGYNANLNKRLARKDTKFKSRNEQLDLVIVVDRLLTGFDAPCLSTIFIDRQPMGPHDLIQAFSRTNRIFDKNKTYGQIVTFQAPKLFKESVDKAVALYSAGGTKGALMAEWDEVEPAFKKALAALRASAATPSEIPAMSDKEKRIFLKMFREFDSLFAQIKSFTNYEDSMLEEYGITEDEYYDYAAHYLNVKEELRPKDAENEDDSVTTEDMDYELMAYSHTKIDYEYIIALIQNIVNPDEKCDSVTPEDRKKKIEEVKQYVEELRKENPKIADIMSNIIDDIELDETKYRGQSILNIVENTKIECIDKVITDFCIQWYASKDEVMYAATHYRDGEVPNESAIKATIDFTTYKQSQEKALKKFEYYKKMMDELRKTLEEEIKPLLSH